MTLPTPRPTIAWVKSSSLLGQYDGARGHLLGAYAAPDRRAARQLLGETYAVAGEGEMEEVAALWRRADIEVGQLQLQRWRYGAYLRDRKQAEWVSQAATGAER